jgi:hypothetical protein
MKKKFLLTIDSSNNRGLYRLEDCLTMLEDIIRSMKNKGWIDSFSLEPAQPQESAEEQKTPTNSESDEIAALRKEIQSLREVVGHHQTFVGLHTPLGGNSARLA